MQSIYKDRTQRWRMVHIIISSVMALLFVGQAITGTRMLLGVPLSWQEPYIQQLYEQQLPTLLERCLIALSQQTLQDQVSRRVKLNIR